VKDVNDLARIIHEAFYVARTGRPGPVVVDIPKDVQFAKGTTRPARRRRRARPTSRSVKGDLDKIKARSS
jgi:acetolactate synthase-1/2/3 large subunit